MSLEYLMDHIVPPKVIDYTMPPDQPVQPFALVSIGEYISGEQYFTKRSGLNQYLILYTKKGCGSLAYMDKSYTLTPGTIAVVNCMHSHEYKTAPGEYWHLQWVHFAGQAAFDIMDRMCLDGEHLWNYNGFNKYLSELKRCATANNKHSALELCLALHSLLVESARQKDLRTQNDNARFIPLLNKSVAYMQMNYENKLSIDEIAKHIAVSKYHFIRIFFDMYGMTPYQYLTTIRINEAKKLLRLTDCPVYFVAEATGYSDIKTFIASFKKATGVTPSQFRKNI